MIGSELTEATLVSFISKIKDGSPKGLEFSKVFISEYMSYKKNRTNFKILFSSIESLKSAIINTMALIPIYPTNLCHMKTLLNIMIIAAIETKRFYQKYNNTNHDKKSFEALKYHDETIQYEFVQAIREVLCRIVVLKFPQQMPSDQRIAFTDLIKVLIWLSYKTLMSSYGIKSDLSIDQSYQTRKLMEYEKILDLKGSTFPSSSLLLAELLNAEEGLLMSDFTGTFDLGDKEKKRCQALNMCCDNMLNRQTAFALMAIWFVPGSILPKWNRRWSGQFAGKYGMTTDNTLTDSYHTLSAIKRLISHVRRCDISGVEQILENNRCVLCRFGGYIRFATFIKLKVRIQLFKRLVRLLARLEHGDKITIERDENTTYIPLTLYGLAISRSLSYSLSGDLIEAARYAVLGSKRYKLIEWDVTSDSKYIKIENDLFEEITE